MGVMSHSLINKVADLLAVCTWILRIGYSGLAGDSQNNNNKKIMIMSKFTFHLLLNLTQVLSMAAVFKIFCSNMLYSFFSYKILLRSSIYISKSKDI